MKKVVLKRKISTRIANGHPWIFANEINLMDDEIEPGEIADVFRCHFTSLELQKKTWVY
ncbi:MAG: hypothetical protein LW706_05015 [Chitinophagaceae bacterium]|nr:hypothetical protein [Chitinophagaceae bacterium]